MNARLIDLEQLLAAHRGRDAEEQSHLSRMRALLQSAGDPCSRAHFAPGHFTASAFVLSPSGDALLLIFHQKLKRWLQPGGHIDADDATALAAARRELAEEVGLADAPLSQIGLFDVDIHDIPSLSGEPAHAHFDLRFVFRATDLSFAVGSDAEAAKWLPLDEISDAVSDRSVMRAVEKLRGTLS